MNDDYPVGRGVFKEENSNFAILVNFEDHIEIVMSPSYKNLVPSLNSLKRLMKAFEKIGFANDAYLGYLTVNPLFLGTGLRLNTTFANLSKTEDDCESLMNRYNVRACLTEDECGVILESSVTLSSNYTETHQICEFFEGMQALCR